jgi:hypothetical protein
MDLVLGDARVSVRFLEQAIRWNRRQQVRHEVRIEASYSSFPKESRKVWIYIDLIGVV